MLYEFINIFFYVPPLHMSTIATYVAKFLLTAKPEPIMLLVLPIIPSRNFHNFYPLFLFYSHAITYYSCYIL